MIVKLPFGTGTCPVDLRGVRVRPLIATAPLGSKHPEQRVLHAVDEPIAGPGFDELCAGRGDATIIVPDATRAIDLPRILPGLIHRLGSCGVELGNITVLVACGTHPAVDANRLRECVGPLPDDVKVVQHDARKDDSLVAVGSVADRVIRIHRIAAEAGLLITLGAVKHHYFAGFGGGPKMVFPGVAGFREIQHNHALVIAGGVRDPRCEPGVLAGNPVAEDIAEAADLRPVDCAVCVVPGREGGIAGCIAGPWRASFDAAVEHVRDWYEVTAPDPFKLAVASGGGAPSDSTLIQAHKGLDAACRFVADGGEILYVADLSQGPGSPDMEPFLEKPTEEIILDRLRRGWIQYGHTTLRLVEKTARFKIHLVSRLDEGLARRLGFEPVDDPADVIDSWRRRFPGETAAVFPGAPVYPVDGLPPS